MLRTVYIDNGIANYCGLEEGSLMAVFTAFLLFNIDDELMRLQVKIFQPSNQALKWR